MNPASWPTGGPWIVGGVSLLPEQLVSEFPSEFPSGFERDVDDLDEFDAAYINDEEIGPILFLRHVRTPEAGTEVLVDAGVTRKAADAALRRRLRVVKVPYSWRTPSETCADSLAAAVAESEAHREGGVASDSGVGRTKSAGTEAHPGRVPRRPGRDAGNPVSKAKGA